MLPDNRDIWREIQPFKLNDVELFLLEQATQSCSKLFTIKTGDVVRVACKKVEECMQSFNTRINRKQLNFCGSCIRFRNLSGMIHVAGRSEGHHLHPDAFV